MLFFLECRFALQKIMSKCQLIRFTVLTASVVFHDISYSFFLHLYQHTEKLLANLSETTLLAPCILRWDETAS